MANYFKLEEEYFIIDSEKLEEVRTKLYGFFVCDKGIIENTNLSEKNKDEMYGCGVYVYVENDGSNILIKQDINACYGIFVFKKDGYFAISNSWQYLVDYIKHKYTLSLNRDYANHMFVMQLASYTMAETMVNEIKVLQGDAVVNINILNKSMHVERIDYEENKYFLDSDDGLAILDRWFHRWTKVIRCIKERTNNMIVELSGGFDSRLTFLLVLCSGIDLNEIRVNSRKGELHTFKEDYAIASQIADYYGFSLNKDLPTGRSVRLSLEDIINMCFYNKMIFHKQMYFKFNKFQEKRYLIPGVGGEAIRDHWTILPKELVGKFERRTNKYSKSLKEEITSSLSTVFDKAFRQAADEHDIVDMDSEEITLWVYKNGRCRAHFGTAVAEEIFINQFDLAPLLDPDLRKLKLCTEACADKNLLMALIYVRYCPELLKFPFEGGRQIDEKTIEYAYSINEKRAFKTSETAAEEFELITYDSRLTENENERVQSGEPDEYLKNVFESEKCKRIFCSYFNEELYDIAEKNLMNASYHPLSECFTVIAVVKCLIDVQISEEISRKSAFDDMKYLLLNNLPRYSNDKNSCLCELKEKLSHYDRIIIYGTGMWGDLLLEKIYDWHLYKRVEFVTSDELEVKEHLGHDIYNISKIHIEQDNYIVIAAVRKRLEEEIINKLEQLHISSYIRLSDEMRNALMGIGDTNGK